MANIPRGWRVAGNLAPFVGFGGALLYDLLYYEKKHAAKPIVVHVDPSLPTDYPYLPLHSPPPVVNRPDLGLLYVQVSCLMPLRCAE